VTRPAATRAHSIAQLQVLARRRLPQMVLDFLEGGAEDEYTLRSNMAAFSARRLRPRVLVDVGTPDLSTELLGERFDLPLLLAPVGLTALAHPDGELAAARAALRAGTRLIASTAASYRVEEIAAAASSPPPWFQLYPWGDRRVIAQLLDRAAACHIRVLCVTVDVPVVGQRERDLANGFTVPLRLRPRHVVDVVRHPGWAVGLARRRRITFANLQGMDVVPTDRALALVDYAQRLNDPTTTWDTIDWIRGRWSGPLLIKGVAHPDDARRALDHGADGVVVSNHGGRQLDRVAATIDLLPDVVSAMGGDGVVLMDGGIRRGVDIAIALALGADAVLIGRPYLYGLAADGEEGVVQAIRLLGTELERVLALLGVPDVGALSDELFMR
jgi:isopentenyl diphosphate isomerase/L-lactate dehydrogenase-like FMN-dependent dehydrogenase